MADVAAHAGVSLSTASLALSGGRPISARTKERVESAARELGYAGPSPQGRALRSGRSGVVGLVLHQELARSFRDPLNLRVLDSLIEDLGKLGQGVLLIPHPTRAAGEQTLLDTAPMDAVVVLRVQDQHEPAIDAARRRGLPVVVMEGTAPEGSSSLTIDDTEATVQLINHVRSLGHASIATVTLPFRPEDETRIVEAREATTTAWVPTRHRLDAFARAGVEPCVIVRASASTVEAGVEAGHLALGHESGPTAIICQSDLLAAGVILAARARALSVPQDVSITGFDGLDLPWLAPHRLTTIGQDGAAKGHALARLVKRLLDGEAPEHVSLPVVFQQGNTTGAAPASP